MSQVLLQEERPKPSEAQLADFDETPLTLAKIWRRAEKELTQVRGDFGRRSTKRACAAGAIVFYLGAGDDDYLNSSYGSIRARECLQKAQKLLTAEFEGQGIAEMNDIHHWTFGQFAEWAEKHNI